MPRLGNRTEGDMVVHLTIQVPSKVSEDQIFYLNQRGISTEDAVGMIVSGYAKEVFQQLPMEFAVEAQNLMSVSLEGSVG